MSDTSDNLVPAAAVLRKEDVRGSFVKLVHARRYGSSAQRVAALHDLCADIDAYSDAK